MQRNDSHWLDQARIAPIITSRGRSKQPLARGCDRGELIIKSVCPTHDITRLLTQARLFHTACPECRQTHSGLPRDEGGAGNGTLFSLIFHREYLRYDNGAKDSRAQWSPAAHGAKKCEEEERAR
jgi:hypothetical protein